MCAAFLSYRCISRKRTETFHRSAENVFSKEGAIKLAVSDKDMVSKMFLCQQRLCVKDVAVLGNCIKDVPLSAEAAERISLFLLFLLLLAEVATPAGSRLQVQQTKRGGDTGQSQGELP